jgi:protoheme IX farnesyltransferase
MKRTSTRPTVTQSIPSTNALWYALVLAGGSFLLLWLAANLLSAMLALAGLVFYVIIYTMLLKRRTWHNIVIGGAAGAFPPLVGWAAVAGNLSPLAWYLFAIIFVWTPVHFWALALLIKDDYASVGVPMLPVVRGDRATVVQIAAYAVLTALVSVLPFFVQREVGLFYLCAAIFLNGFLLAQSVRLYQKIERPRASSLFHYSMLYLALLFLMMAVDRAIHL